MASGGGKSIIAVVGAGHRAGIQNYLLHPETLPRPQSVEDIPKKRFSFLKAFGSHNGLAISAGSLWIVADFSCIIQDPWHGIHMVVSYYRRLSALGTALARGHPYSVLTSFMGCMMTTLNRLLAAGWYAGLREAKYRNPTTKDLKSLMNAESMKDMMKNNFFQGPFCNCHV